MVFKKYLASDEALFSSFAKQIHLPLPSKNKQRALKSLRLKKGSNNNLE